MSEGKRSIKWDEEVIAEHDKERGTRQKIDEPPTPFQYGSDHSDAESEPGDLAEAILERGSELESEPGDLAEAEMWGGTHPALDLSELQTKLKFEKHLREAAIESREAALILSRREQTVFNCDSSKNFEATSSQRFKDQRNAHYNEFKVIQAMRMRTKTTNDDDDDDDVDG